MYSGNQEQFQELIHGKRPVPAQLSNSHKADNIDLMEVFLANKQINRSCVLYALRVLTYETSVKSVI